MDTNQLTHILLIILIFTAFSLILIHKISKHLYYTFNQIPKKKIIFLYIKIGFEFIAGRSFDMLLVALQSKKDKLARISLKDNVAPPFFFVC